MKMTYKDDLLSNYDYEIPEELIAQKPVENREEKVCFENGYECEIMSKTESG
jgi:S-adenosylmethionine:tRNA-ribosyltransferase-isomerase (queuine synthetase)